MHSSRSNRLGSGVDFNPTPPMLHVSTFLIIVFSLLGSSSLAVEENYVTTLLNTTASPRGIFLDARTRAIFYTQLHSVWCIHSNGTLEPIAGSTSSGNADGIGAAAAFGTPWGLTRSVNDPNTMLVVDRDNACVRRVSLWNRSVSAFVGLCGTAGTIDGTGQTARFNSPIGIVLVRNATTGKEYLYVGDSSSAVRRVDFDTRYVGTFAGSLGAGGTADGSRLATARFARPAGVAVDATGQWLYVADKLNHCVRRVDAIGGAGMVSTVAGTCNPARSGLVDGVGGVVKFKDPQGLAINARGTVLYVVEPSSNCAIRRITLADGNVTTVSGGMGCGTVVDGPLATARFNWPLEVQHYESKDADDAVEGLLVTDYNGAIRRITLEAPPTMTGSVASASLSGSKSHYGGTTTTTVLPSQSQRTPSASANTSKSCRSVSTSNTLSPRATTTMRVTRATMTTSATPSLTATSTPSLSTSVSQLLRSMTTSQTSSGSAGATAGGARRLLPTHSISLSVSSWSCGEHDARSVSLSAPQELPSLGTPVLGVAPREQAPLGDASSPIVRLFAAPLPRVALLASSPELLPQLLLHVTMKWAAAARWNIVAATAVRGDGVEEALVLGARTTATITDGTAATHSVLLQPPPSSSMGWLPEGMGVFAPSGIIVQLTIACAADRGNTSGRVAVVRVEIPAPGFPRELAEKVETTATAAQWTTAVGGPGAGSAVGRVGAVRSMMLCGGGGDNGGPSGGGLLGIQLVVVACERGGGSVSFARGAVVGNTVILVGSTAVLFLAALVYAKAARVSLLAGGLRLAAPSVLLPVWIATLPSTSAGTAELLNHALPGCPADVGVGCLGVLVCALPLAWIGFVGWRLVPQLGLRRVEKPPGPAMAAATGPGSATLLRRFRRIANEVQRRRIEWEEQRGVTRDRPTNEDGGASSTLHRHHGARHARVLLLEFSVLWYAALDVGVLIASGILSAMSGVGSQSLCIGAAASVALLYGGQLFLCAISRPFTTTFALVHALMTLTMSAISVGLQIAGMMEASSGRTDVASLDRQRLLETGSAACDLSIIGISATRVVFDAISFSKASVRILGELRNSTRNAGATAQPAGARNGTDPPGDDVGHHALPETTVVKLPDVVDAPTPATSEPDDDENVFWDATGSAILPLPLRADANDFTDALDDIVVAEAGKQKKHWASDLTAAFESMPMPHDDASGGTLGPADRMQQPPPRPQPKTVDVSDLEDFAVLSDIGVVTPEDKEDSILFGDSSDVQPLAAASTHLSFGPMHPRAVSMESII